MLEDKYVDILKTRSTRTGGDTGTITDVTTTIRGFIQPLRSSQTYTQSKAGETGTHRLYTYTSTDLIYQDRIELNNQKYVVIEHIQPNGISAVGHHKEIILEATI